MISGFQIAQSAHFRAIIRFIGDPCQDAVEIEHHPQHDPTRTWFIARPHAHPALASWELEIWTVYGERRAFRLRFTATDTSPEPTITVTADDHGLTILGIQEMISQASC